MVNLALSWHEAGISAACLAVAAVAARRSGRPALVAAAGFARETAVVLALFGLWQLAGTFVLMGPEGAVDRGQWIWQAERAVHLPSETAVQLAFLPHPLIVQALNLDVAPEDIKADEPLYGDGLGLDSIDVLEIALVVSKRYGLQLRADNDDNHRIFSSLASLTDYIAGHKAA